MAWTANWDGDFLVDGAHKLRLTPNFRLNEFKDDQGKVHVHRELVSTLQLLRDRFKASISVKSTDEDGLGATISSRSLDDLLQTAKALEDLNFFESVQKRPDGVNVRIHKPGDRIEVDLEQALMTAFMVTARFETSGDPFKQITGNFDGAGISFGPSQWNFKSRTLKPLFRRFQKEDEAALRACFMHDGDDSDYDHFLAVLDLEDVEKQIQWGESISTGSRLADVSQPWNSYFRKVGAVERFRSIMVEESLVKYGEKMLREVKYLQLLVPGIQVDHLRAVCALYDLVIQQGSLDKARAEIEARVNREKPTDQLHLVRIAVEERGFKASKRWRADTVSRRKGILEGVPITVDKDDHISQRVNINFYMLRNVHIKDAKALMNSNVMEQLMKVSNAIAEGKTLTAV